MRSSIYFEIGKCIGHHQHHSTGEMYFGRYDSNVQDPRAQLFDHGLFAFSAVPRWNQVWGLPGHHYRYAHERVFLVHFQSQSESLYTRQYIEMELELTSSPWRNSQKKDP
jgi:hypothetical protein